MNIAKIIEQDDIIEFKSIFLSSKINDKIAKITNYASIKSLTSSEMGEPLIDECDALKYSVHMGATKIFNYLISLPKISMNSYGKNYGWPILLMALKNENYDFAEKIIDHHTFSLLDRAHLNCFIYFQKKPNVEKHINFLYKYSNKFTADEFIYTQSLQYNLIQLISHSENCFFKINDIFLSKLKSYHSNFNSILSVYISSKQSFLNLCDYAIAKHHKTSITKRLNKKDIQLYLSEQLKMCGSSTPLLNLFHNENQEDARLSLQMLLTKKGQLKKIIFYHPILLSYLNLDNIMYLEKNAITSWDESLKFTRAIDYIAFSSRERGNEEVINYYANNFPEKLLERAQQVGEYKKNKILPIIPRLEKIILDKNLFNPNAKANTFKI